MISETYSRRLCVRHRIRIAKPGNGCVDGQVLDAAGNLAIFLCTCRRHVSSDGSPKNEATLLESNPMSLNVGSDESASRPDNMERWNLFRRYVVDDFTRQVTGSFSDFFSFSTCVPEAVLRFWLDLVASSQHVKQMQRANATWPFMADRRICVERAILTQLPRSSVLLRTVIQANVHSQNAFQS